MDKIKNLGARFSLLNTSTKVVLSIVALIVIMPAIGAFAASLPYDPFDKYGKTLPWSEINNWNDGKAMILTKNPNSHMTDFGYYAQDFARYLPNDTLNTTVHAISDGIVEKVVKGWGTSQFHYWGNYVIIDHGNGYKSRYSHLGRISLPNSMVGETIRKGTEIGYIGETGNITSPNLEFALTYNGRTVKAFHDGGTYEGKFKKLPWASNSYQEGVATFENEFWKYKSSTVQRPDDSANPFDPPYFDALEGYLESYGYEFPSGMIAEPVNAGTGNFVHRNKDLEIKTQVGPELKFERFYNSLSKYNSSLGIGWSNSFDYKILPHLNSEDPGAVLYSMKMADGRGETFKETDNDPLSFTGTFESLTDFSLGKLERLDETGSYKFVYTDENQVVYIFNSDTEITNGDLVASPTWGKVESITDRYGKSLTFSYDSDGNLVKVENSFGEFFNFEYNNGKLTKLTDQSGKVVNYKYNYDGFLGEVVKSNGESWKYTYDNSGNILSITDANGTKFVINKYDDQNRVVEQIDGRGNVVSFDYSLEKNILGQETGNTVTKFTDANGNVLTYIHDENYYLISESKGDGSTLRYEYNQDGRLIAEIDPNGNTVRFERDTLGNITKQTLPNGSEIISEYNEKGLITKISDNSGDRIFEYNDQDLVVKSTDKLGYSTSYEYDENGLLVKTINPDNSSEVYSYDNKGRLITEENVDAGTRFEYKYDASGNKIEIKDKLGRITKVEFNALNNPTKVIDPMGYFQTYGYDKSGNVVSQTDELGNKTTFKVDANENIISTNYPNSSSVKVKFDANNNKIEETDRNGNITKLIYDNADRLVRTEYFDNSGNKLSEVSSKYDSKGNKIQSIDAAGNITYFEYDNLDRLVKVTNPLGYSNVFEYDFSNNLVKEVDYEGGETIYSHDANGNVLTQTDSEGNTTSFEYDYNGKIIKKIDAKGGETKYDYNSIGQLVSMTNAKGDSAIYTYDQAGRLITQTNFAGDVTTFEYDANDNLISQINALGDIKRTEFNKRSDISKVVDENGNVTTLDYDSVGNLVSTTDALGNSSQMKYDGESNLVEYIGEDGNNIRFKYDGLGRKIEEIDQAGNSVKYSYDQLGNLIQTTDKLGNTTKFDFDKLGRLIKRTDALGQIETYKYSPNSNIIEIVNARGTISKSEYDKLGRVVKSINPLGNSKTTTYDELGYVVSQSDFSGNEFKYSYDELGNLVSKINRAGNETKLSYDAQGRNIEIVDALGGVSKFEYDALGRNVKEINPNGGITAFTYDKVSNVTSQTDPNGNVTQFVYDNLNRNTQIIDAYGNVEKVSFDKLGRVVSSTDRNQNSTNLSYDKLGNIVSVVKANGAKSQFSYDAAGNIISAVDPLGNVTKYNYDKLGREIAQILPDGNKLETLYDELGRVGSEIDPKGNFISYKYDLIGNLISETDRLGNTSRFEYDPNGNVIKSIDKLGNSITAEYSVNDELLKAVNPLGDSKLFEYDSLGRTVKEVLENGAVNTFSYDSVGNELSSKDALGNETKFSYDFNNNLIEVENAKGQITKNNFDKLNRIASIVDANGGVKSTTYDSIGNIIAETDQNGNTTRYSYDKVYNLINETNALGYKSSASYNLNNNLVAETDRNGNTTKYSYDNLSRLVTKTLPGGNKYSYQYDANSNLVAELLPKGNTNNFVYDANDQLIQSSDGLGNTTKVEFDKVGRTIQKTDALGASTNYSYDSLGRLQEVKDALGRSTKYSYDKVGNLISELNANGSETKYEVDLLGNLTKETNALGNNWSFEYDSLSNLVKEIDAKGQVTTSSYDNLNRKIGEISNDDSLSFTYDKVGNIIKLSNSNLTENYKYDAVYNLISQSDSRGVSQSFSYDPNQNRTSVVYFDGEVVKNTYNTNNLISTQTVVYDGDQVSSLNPQSLTTTFKYDANLNLVEQVNPNNTLSTRSYDSVDRIIELNNLRLLEDGSQESFAKYSYELNANGAKVKEIINGKVGNMVCDKKTQNSSCDGQDEFINEFLIVKNYKYDVLNQIIEVSSQKGISIDNLSKDYVENYSYDNLGNRTSLKSTNFIDSTSSFSTNYNYNEINQLSSDSKYSYSYDKNGNRLSKLANDKSEVYKYGYNSLDQLVNVETQTGEGVVLNPNSGKIKSQITFDFDYMYDGLGRRISKVNNTDYTVCKGNGERGNDSNPLDCDNGAGNDNRDKVGSYATTSISMFGIDRIDYYYDGFSYETLTENFDRADSSSTQKENYFGVYTNFHKVDAGSINSHMDLIVSATNKAVRDIPSTIDCKGNGEHRGDTDFYDCNNGLGNDLLNLENKTPNVISEFDSNEFINYYHYDGLSSVVATSNYDISYKLEVGSLIEEPVVNTPNVQDMSVYNAYGQREIFTTSPIKENVTHQIPNTPYAYGFQNWNSKQYSIKEYDPETKSNYYGSRYYDSQNGTWNKQDSYRGTLDNPQSRHRYAFVENNPVNAIDYYGYSNRFDIVAQFNAVFGDHSKMESDRLISRQNFIDQQNNAQKFILNYQDDISKASVENTNISNLINRYKTVKSSTIVLGDKVIRNYWNMRYQKNNLNNEIQMSYIFLRLKQRGYNIDFIKVNRYINSKIDSALLTFNNSVTKYNSAINTYRNSVQEVNKLSEYIRGRITDYNNLVDSINSRDNKFEASLNILKNTSGFYESEAKYAEWQASKSLAKSVLGMSFCAGSTILSAGVAGFTCGAMSVGALSHSASAVNDTINAGDFYQASITGSYENSKVKFLENNLGLSWTDSQNISNTVDLASGFAKSIGDTSMIMGVAYPIIKPVISNYFSLANGLIESGINSKIVLGSTMYIGAGALFIDIGTDMVENGLKTIDLVNKYIQYCSITQICNSNDSSAIGEYIGNGSTDIIFGGLSIGSGIYSVFNGVKTLSTIFRTKYYEILQEIATKAYNQIMREYPNGSMQTNGTRMHKVAADLVDADPRLRGVSTEISYDILSGEKTTHGKGTIRMDVVIGNSDGPKAIYDFKFGKAGLTDSRILEIRTVLRNPKLPVFEVRPIK